MISSFCLGNFMTKSLMYGTFRAKLPTARRILLFIYLTTYLFIPFYAGAVISQDICLQKAQAYTIIDTMNPLCTVSLRLVLNCLILYIWKNLINILRPSLGSLVVYHAITDNIFLCFTKEIINHFDIKCYCPAEFA